jgi:hypothetical protein
VPALVIQPQEPRETRAEVSADGYAYALFAPDGPIQVTGSRQPGAAAAAGPGSMTWSQDGITYTLSAPPTYSPQQMAETAARLTPVNVALSDEYGFAFDTPLLFVVYLPLLLAFVGLGVWLIRAEL